jgi:hypothetical protein
LGASGAIAAVMGVFLITFPRDRIRTLLLFGWFARITLVPAILLVGLWFLTQLLSGVGTAAAYVITVVLRDSVPGIKITQEVLLRAMPATGDVVLSVIVAIGAGIAASLALTADPRIVAKPWGQIIDAMIGVEIAISLLPPASVIGIGLAFGRLDISRNAFWLLVVNVIGLDFAGSMLMLAIRGVRLRYLTLEKRIRQIAQDVVAGQIAYPPDTLASDITAAIAHETGYRSRVVVELTPCQMHSRLRPEDISLERTIFGS